MGAGELREAVQGSDMVGSVMKTHVVAIEGEGTLRQAARALKSSGVGTLVIMDGASIAGIASERDVAQAIADGLDPDDVRVADVMSEDPRYLTPGDNVATALDIMLDAHVRHLPVVDDGELVGIVSIRDLARSLCAPEA